VDRVQGTGLHGCLAHSVAGSSDGNDLILTLAGGKVGGADEGLEGISAASSMGGLEHVGVVEVGVVGGLGVGVQSVGAGVGGDLDVLGVHVSAESESISLLANGRGGGWQGAARAIGNVDIGARVPVVGIGSNLESADGVASNSGGGEGNLVNLEATGSGEVCEQRGVHIEVCAAVSVIVSRNGGSTITSNQLPGNCYSLASSPGSGGDLGSGDTTGNTTGLDLSRVGVEGDGVFQH